MLSNTYHLHLRPGEDLVAARRAACTSSWTWHKPILTDSGGFQVFSLAGIRKIKEEGVAFQSHLDGSATALSPRKISMDIQHEAGQRYHAWRLTYAPPYPCDHDTAEDQRWSAPTAGRSAARSTTPTEDQALFGIVQGAFYKDLRIESAKTPARIWTSSATASAACPWANPSP